VFGQWKAPVLPAFVFQVHPVIPVEDAVRGELEVIAWARRTERKVTAVLLADETGGDGCSQGDSC